MTSARGQSYASMGKAIQEFGEWVVAHTTALEDGTINTDELARVEGSGSEAIAAIAAVIEQARESAVRPSLRAVAR